MQKRNAETNTKIIERMQKLLDSFSIPLRVLWSPDPESKCHGEIKNVFLMLYDTTEEDTWDTFTHELIEYKLKNATMVYRETINSLMEAIERLSYHEKEVFIESMPTLISKVQKERTTFSRQS